MIRFNFLPKFSVVIFIAFILFTIIGTLTHELGHAVVAKYLGYDSKVSYGSMTYNYKGYEHDKDVKEIKILLDGHNYEDYEEWPEDLKLKVEAQSALLREKYPQNKSNDLWVAIGGPAQTISTSFFGLLILFLRRKKREISFKLIDWLCVFLSLFILREVYNFVSGLYSYILYSKSCFNGDEYRISNLLGYNEWLIPAVILIPSIIISLFVIFKIIPIKYRFTFIISGMIGGLSGFAIWFGFLGGALFE